MPDEPADKDKTPEQDTITPATPPKAEDRLQGLLTQPNAAATVLGQITNANAQIEQRLAGLEKTLAQLAQTPPSAAPKDLSSSEYSSIFGKPSAQETAPPNAGSALDTNAITSIVQKAVSEAVAPIVTRVQQDDAKQALLSKQKVSFAQAAQSLPALADAGTPEAQLFDQIYQGMPELQKLERAPQIIAEMVRGFSVTQRQEDRQIADRKSQAAAEVPRYGTIEVPDDTSKAKELKDKLIDEGSKRGLDVDGLADYMRLQVGTEVANQTKG